MRNKYLNLMNNKNGYAQKLDVFSLIVNKDRNEKKLFSKLFVGHTVERNFILQAEE